MSAELFQFPNKYHTPVHAIRNGEPWWVYKISYDSDTGVETVYIWARSEEDAVQRVEQLKASATFVGRLKEIIEGEKS